MVDADTILNWLKGMIESKKPIPHEAWIDAGFKLVILLEDEHLEMENLRAIVAGKKLKIYQSQEKKNVAACDMEIEAEESYRNMRLQEHRVARIEEYIKLCKKNANQF